MNVTLDMDEMDLTAAERKATYEEIKKYVAKHNDGMKVSNLYIAQIKPVSYTHLDVYKRQVLHGLKGCIR